MAELPDINLPINNDILDDILDDVLDEGVDFLGDFFGFATHPIDRLKANITSYTKPSRFSVLVTPPQGLAVNNSELSNITMACHTATGMGEVGFGTYDKRHGEGILRRLPNDVIYPEITLSFYNILVFDEMTVYNFWVNWLRIINSGGFGYYDEYVGALDIGQYGENGKKVINHKITNFYPTSVSMDDLNYAGHDAIQSVSVTGSWY